MEPRVLASGPGAMVVTHLALSLTFQAQFLAVVHARGKDLAAPTSGRRWAQHAVPLPI